MKAKHADFEKFRIYRNEKGKIKGIYTLITQK